MNMFQDKKILFISPKFFGYEKAVYNKLKELGATVDYIDDRPSNNVFVKAILRVHHKLLYKKLERYFEEQFEQIKHKDYNIVFILNPEGMLPGIIQKFKEHFSKARFILYMWDSIKNRKHTPNVLPFFDIKFSFDRQDAELFPGVRFRPLFFSDVYRDAAKTIGYEQFDISFIGTAHSDRYFILKKIEEQLISHKRKYFYFFFLTSSKYYWFRKLTEPDFLKTARKSDFSFLPMPAAQIVDIFVQSRAVLDINHPQQSGLTIRTLEVLALQRKIITTNANIKQYNFYHPNNILVLDRSNPVIDWAFLDAPFEATNPEILHSYSLEGWLKEIFSN